MLHLIFWLGVYSLLLLAIAQASGELDRSRVFKLAFFPATIVAVFVQIVAALLTVGRTYQISLFASGKPAFCLQPKKKVPILAGAVFVLVSHAALYALFLAFVTVGEREAQVEVRELHLPSVTPHELVEGQIDVDLRGYLRGFPRLWDAAKESPVFYGILAYIFVPAFALVRLQGRAAQWTATVMIALALVVYTMDWFGLDYRFFSRGWWARWIYFPGWWALFSLFVTGALAMLAASIVPAFARLFARKSEKA